MKQHIKKRRLILGSGVMVLIGIASFLVLTPSPKFLSSSVIASESHAETEQVELKIEGMTCRKCVKPMRKALLTLPGVSAAEVSYSEANAKVEFEKGKVSDQQLVQAIEEKSNFFYTYKAKVISRK